MVTCDVWLWCRVEGQQISNSPTCRAILALAVHSARNFPTLRYPILVDFSFQFFFQVLERCKRFRGASCSMEVKFASTERSHHISSAPIFIHTQGTAPRCESHCHVGEPRNMLQGSQAAVVSKVRGRAFIATANLHTVAHLSAPPRQHFTAVDRSVADLRRQRYAHLERGPPPGIHG